MKAAALLLFSALIFSSCDKLKDKVNDQIDNMQTSFVSADVTYDDQTVFINPNVCNPVRALGFYTVNASTIDNFPLLGVNGSFKLGETIKSEDNDIFMVFRKGKGDDNDNLYNSTIKSKDFREPTLKINITKLDGRFVQGTFEGVLYNKNGDSCIVKNGNFDATTKF